VIFVDEFEELISWLDAQTKRAPLQKRMISTRDARRSLN